MSGIIHVQTAATNSYAQTNLVSDLAGRATHQDPNLVNGWGLDKSPTGPWWVNSNGKGLSLLYDGTGTPNPLDVTAPAAPGNTSPGTPTGIVFNATSDFQIAPEVQVSFSLRPKTELSPEGTQASMPPTP